MNYERKGTNTMTEFTLQLGNGQTAVINYNFGTSVEETNEFQLDASRYQEKNSFVCSCSMEVELSTTLAKALEFGFLANTLSSTRNAFYSSSKKTKVTAAIGAQCLDGDGEADPFTEAPTLLPKTAGKHSLSISYRDNPLLTFPRVDEHAEGEGNTLTEVSGQDVHKVWLAVGNPLSGGLTVIDSARWEVTWGATINNTTGKVEITGSAGLLEKGTTGPVWEGQLANDAFTITETTW
jgi:hypothetical protein